VVDDDERILPLLKKLKYRYLGEDFSSVGSQIKGQIQLSQIDKVCLCLLLNLKHLANNFYLFTYFIVLQISKESFPPCMRHLHETLRREHHLKHFARLQYGLFLKSIGLTLEQALTLWRNEFIKKIEPEKVSEVNKEIINLCKFFHFCIVRQALFVQHTTQLRQGREKSQLHSL